MANNPSQANNSNVSIARMSSYGTLGGSPEWHTVPWIEIVNPTAQTTGAVHDTGDPTNQYEPESTVDLTAAPGLRVGFTAEMFDVLLPYAMRSTLTGPQVYDALATRPTSKTSAHFVVPAQTALPEGTLVWVSGCAVAADNGLKHVAASSTTTNIIITGGLTAESFTNAQNVTIRVCGFQFATDDATLTVSGSTITLGATAKNLTQLALEAGQSVFLGDAAGGAYNFTNANMTTGVNYGPARVVSAPTSSAIVLEHTFGTWVSGTGTSKTIRLRFGQQIRVVARTDADYAEPYAQIETSVENLGAANATRYGYNENAGLNTCNIAAPAAALVTLGADFLATDTTWTDTQRTNASAPVTAVRVVPYNTTTDISGRLFLVSGGTALTGYISAANLILEHQATPNPAHGVLGSAITTFGKLRVKAEITAFMTESASIDAARASSDVRANWWLRNSECAYVFDIPSARIQTGPANFPKNQVVTHDLPLMANRDTTYGTSLIVSVLPGCPALPARA